MFTIIESNELESHKPGGHAFHQSEIKTLLRLLKSYQHLLFPFEEREKASFLIADHKQQGMYGGAILYRQQTLSFTGLSSYKHHQDTIEDVISAFQSEGKEVWMARLCLRVDRRAFPLTSETFQYHEDFYKKLLKYFIAFGKKEGMGFLALTLQLRDYINTKSYGWPYVLEIKPRDASDRLFHGVLALQVANIESQYQSLQKQDLANIPSQPERPVQ